MLSYLNLCLKSDHDDVDNLAVIVVNQFEKPKRIIMYYNTLGEENMKKLLLENVDLSRGITFAVSTRILSTL